jgi:hypothetical protein
LLNSFDHPLFDLGEIGRVVDELAFRLCRGDQLRRAEIVLGPRGRAGERKAGNGGKRSDFSQHSLLPLVFSLI